VIKLADVEVLARSRFALTAAALNGVLSWNVTPLRSVNVMLIPSGAIVYAVASCGWYSMDFVLAFHAMLTSRSNTGPQYGVSLFVVDLLGSHVVNDCVKVMCTLEFGSGVAAALAVAAVAAGTASPIDASASPTTPA